MDPQKLRRQADAMAKKAMQIIEAIPAGQPIHSNRDRNRRERSREMMRRASELLSEAEAIEAAS